MFIILENIIFGLFNYGLFLGVVKEIVDNLLVKFGLEKYVNCFVYEFLGG